MASNHRYAFSHSSAVQEPKVSTAGRSPGVGGAAFLAGSRSLRSFSVATRAFSCAGASRHPPPALSPRLLILFHVRAPSASLIRNT